MNSMKDALTEALQHPITEERRRRPQNNRRNGQAAKISAGAFQRLVGEAPDQAAPFLFAICQTLIARIRADNRRYRDSIAFVRTMEP